MRNDSFNFFVPAEIIKAKNENGEEEMLLEGIASTSHKDSQDETLMPEGFDYSYLLKSGFINWHHQLAKDPKSIIGEPIDAKLTKKGFWIKGKLYKDNEKAIEAYELAKILENNSAKRRLGWSIEGKVTERDPLNPARVLKARITGVALTPMPINPHTFVNICKAFGGDDVVDTAEQPDTEENGGQQMSLDMNLKTGGHVRVYNDGRIEIQLHKALTTDSPSGKALRKESLEGGVKPALTKAEAVMEIMQRYPKVTFAKAHEIYKKILINDLKS